ncbi:E3 ubiquitin-protein ligase LRSAM1 [Nymphon striatum]|nr:E3 ubiquitin-protein ligase LRSAM1 [Nymphon striatum]
MKNMSSECAKSKAKLEHKVYLAENCPEPVFDLSACSLSEVPDGVYSVVQSVEKRKNKLSDLDGGGSLDNLQELKVLQLQANRFSYIPSDISHLINLQVLNLAENKLKSLPLGFNALINLQELDLSGNNFNVVPAVILNVTCLQKLKLNENNIKVLPLKMCNMINLKDLQLNGNPLIYPNSEIVHQGTEAIMKFLSSESGTEYVLPNECLPKLEDVNYPYSSEHRLSDTLDSEHYTGSLAQYEKIQEEKRLKNLLYEKELDQNERQHAMLFADASIKNQRLLYDVTKESDKLEEEVMAIQCNKEKSRKLLIQALNSVEKQCSTTIEELLKDNESRKNTENLIAQMEKDRKEIESMLVIKQEESDMLKKMDVLNAMQSIILADAEVQKLYDSFYSLDKSISFEFSEEDNERELLKILKCRDDDQKEMVSELLMQEKYQKEAFESLFINKDDRRNDIINQIYLVQTELASVSAMELRNKDLNQQLAIDVLVDKRETLAILLEQLMEERVQREKDIHVQLKSLEESQAIEEENYWLIQYQRLLNKKPKRLMRNLSVLDERLQSMLIEAQAEDFIPMFARRRITFDNFLNMGDIDLNKIGVWDIHVRDMILNEIQLYAKIVAADIPSAPCEREAGADIPSAPSEEEVGAENQSLPSATYTAPSAPSLPEVNKIWMEAECVICLDNKCDVVFLLCGHVCSCHDCSRSIESCPLCRNEISRKLPLG